MAIFYINAYILTGLTFFAFLMSIIKWRIADLAGKMLCLNITFNFIFGAYDFLLHQRHGVVYHQTFFILDFITQCLFFNFCVAGIRKRNLGLYALLTGIITWASLLVYFRTNFNDFDVPSYINSIQGIINVLLAITALYFLFAENTSGKLRTQPTFWFVTGLLFCWATTYFFWAFQEIFKNNKPVYHFAVIFMLIMNDIYYILLIIGYILYRKRNVTNSTALDVDVMERR